MGEIAKVTVKRPEVKNEILSSQTRQNDLSRYLKSPAEQILFLQKTIGNQAVGRLIKSGKLQAKLRIGQPGDIYEQEADKAAEQVMRMHQGASVLTPASEENLTAIRGVGQPLSESVRAFFEQRFGQDFSQVRVHTDAKAAELARATNARAFTVGKDVVFRAGQYAPETSAGKLLLAHELTHVVQQSQSNMITSPLKLNRQETSSKQQEPKKRAGGSAGKVNYFSHPSFKKQKLTEDNIKRAIGHLLATPIGKEVVNDLESQSVVVNVYFVADNKDMPASGEPAGYCEEVGPNLFNAYVVAGQKITQDVPVGRGVIELQEKIVDRDLQSISDSLFHELLHAWFITHHFETEEGKGTGHTKKVKPTEVAPWGKKYDEEEYDPVFLEKLKKFDKELNELKKKLKSKAGAPVERTPAPGTIQPKLIVGEQDDIYEQEADRVAEQVVAFAQRSSLQQKCDSGLPFPKYEDGKKEAIHRENEQVSGTVSAVLSDRVHLQLNAIASQSLIQRKLEMHGSKVEDFLLLLLRTTGSRFPYDPSTHLVGLPMRDPFEKPSARRRTSVAVDRLNEVIGGSTVAKVHVDVQGRFPRTVIVGQFDPMSFIDFNHVDALERAVPGAGLALAIHEIYERYLFERLPPEKRSKEGETHPAGKAHIEAAIT